MNKSGRDISIRDRSGNYGSGDAGLDGDGLGKDISVKEGLGWDGTGSDGLSRDR